MLSLLFGQIPQHVFTRRKQNTDGLQMIAEEMAKAWARWSA
jgi:hypothetical protein